MFILLLRVDNLVSGSNVPGTNFRDPNTTTPADTIGGTTDDRISVRVDRINGGRLIKMGHTQPGSLLGSGTQK